MKLPFDEKYSGLYDLFYKEKDYPSECKFITEALKKFSKTKVRSILDIGCGTGSHAIPLAKKGYSVVGVDVSGPMLEIARKKSAGLKNLKFLRMDMRKIELREKFDAAIIMFAALGYAGGFNGVKKTLVGIRKHMKPGGILIFDVWNGLAVMSVRPSRKVKIISGPKKKIIRESYSDLDAINQICVVHFKCSVQEKGKRVEIFKNDHVMKFFFPDELKGVLELTGFELLDIRPFMKEGKPSERDWNISVIARAI